MGILETRVSIGFLIKNWKFFVNFDWKLEEKNKNPNDYGPDGKKYREKIIFKKKKKIHKWHAYSTILTTNININIIM